MKNKIIDSNFRELQNNLPPKSEGLVLFGTGGDLDKWINGTSKLLFEEKTCKTSNPADLWKNIYKITTTGGRTDLVMIFKEPNCFKIGKLAIVRLKFQIGSWWSDYLVNYSDQHGIEDKIEIEIED